MSPPLLVLDLDETLLYADERALERPADFRIGPYHAYRRPGLDDFLHAMAECYQLAVWTSSSPSYARLACAELFAGIAELRFAWASDRCTTTRDFETDTWTQAKRLVKLRRLGYDLARVVMVDDSPEKHTKNYGNLVRVMPFLGDPADRELPRLAPYLRRLSQVPNVRAVEKRYWRQG